MVNDAVSPPPRPRPPRWVLPVSVIGGAILLALACAVTKPMPPSTVVMATGAPGGEYSAVGQRYREFLARNGVRLELHATNGSPDNVALLREERSHVSVALVRSGDTSEAEAPERAWGPRFCNGCSSTHRSTRSTGGAPAIDMLPAQTHAKRRRSHPSLPV